MFKSIFFGLNALIMVVITGFMATWVLDEWNEIRPDGDNTQIFNQQSANTAVPDYPDYPGSGRLFVLFIESLRDKTAIDPDLMPYLNHMRSLTTHVQINGVFDATTETAIISALTGDEKRNALGAIRGFFSPVVTENSLIRQAKDSGKKTIVYSDYQTFGPFRQDLEARRKRGLLNINIEDKSYDQIPSALSAFIEGDADMVIYHIDELDAVAHRYGVDHEEYKLVANNIDSIIAHLDKSIPPQDSFIIFGDHGHTEMGRHSFGLNVPTYLLARGPGFASGLEISRTAISVFRFLASWALKIPLDPFYRGPRPFEALKTSSPPNLWGSPSTKLDLSNKDYHTDFSRFLTLIITSIAICLVGILWWTVGQYIFRFENSFWPKSAINPLTIKAMPWLLNHNVSIFRKITLVVALIFTGLGFFAFGILTAHYRKTLDQPPMHLINQVWLAILILGLYFRRYVSPATLSIVFFIVPFLLLFPTFYRFGAPGIFAPAWIVWVSLIFASIVHPVNNPIKETQDPPLEKRRITIMCLGLLYILQLFFFAEGQGQTFNLFTALVPELTPTSLFLRGLMGGIAAFFLIYRRGIGFFSATLALIFAIYVVGVHFRLVPHGGPYEVVTAASLLIASFIFASPRYVGTFFDQPHFGAKSLYLVAMILLSFEMMRMSLDARIDMLLMFAALRLSLFIVESIPSAKRDLPLHGLFLALVGFVGVGWLTLGWGFARIEWGALFDFIPPEFVSRKIGHFLPFILLRFTLPILIVRALIKERCKPVSIFPNDRLAEILAFKYLSLLLIILGIAYSAPQSDAYLEAMVQLGIFMILAVGFL